MPRPCAPQHPDPLPDSCRLCWLYVNDPRYQELWGSTTTPTAHNRKSLRRQSKNRVSQTQSRIPYSGSCAHLGDYLLDDSGNPLTRPCDTCRGTISVPLRSCSVYGVCTEDRRVKNKEGTAFEACCLRGFCPSYSPPNAMIPNTPHTPISTPIPSSIQTVPHIPLTWAYGVTTVPRRFDNYLPRTLQSLTSAGFDKPRLFVDDARGSEQHNWYWKAFPSLEITFHSPRIRTFGNWVLGLAELWIRNPSADRYAMFQDDLVTSLNLRSYLESIPYPSNSYLNLYTFPENQRLIPKEKNTSTPYRNSQSIGFFPSNQRGLGALALVFNRDAVRALLSQSHMIDRPLDAKRGHRSIDGGIVSAMNKAGYKEYISNPSLVQHIGAVSSMNGKRHPQASSFLGESFNLLSLLLPKSANMV